MHALAQPKAVRDDGVEVASRTGTRRTDAGLVGPFRWPFA